MTARAWQTTQRARLSTGAALWRSGDLARLCFVSLGIVFHAGCENMITTIMPAMVRDLGGVEYTGWTFAIYETGSIVAGAATGRLSIYWTVRASMIVAALVFAAGCLASAMAPSMPWLLAGRVISGAGAGALISLSFIAVQRYFPAAVWPQMMAVLSVVWGIAAFTGPALRRHRRRAPHLALGVSHLRRPCPRLRSDHAPRPARRNGLGPELQAARPVPAAGTRLPGGGRHGHCRGRRRSAGRAFRPCCCVWALPA